jgi:hypothetical protein
MGSRRVAGTRSVAPNGDVRLVVTTDGLNGTLRAPKTLSLGVGSVLSRWKDWSHVVEVAELQRSSQAGSSL